MIGWEEIDGALAALEEDTITLATEDSWATMVAAAVTCSPPDAMRLILRLTRTSRLLGPTRMHQLGLAVSMSLLVGHKLGYGRGWREATGG